VDDVVMSRNILLSAYLVVLSEARYRVTFSTEYSMWPLPTLQKKESEGDPGVVAFCVGNDVD
jgi:hypothetical protein